MSKAGVLGHFGNKEALQLAALDSANRRSGPRSGIALPAARGSPVCRAVARAWISYLERDVFPGGCFLTAAATEFDGRPGPVRDRIAGTWRLWHRVLAREAAAAIDGGDLPPGTDAAQVAFEMNAVAMAVNEARQLRSDANAARRGRRAMARILSGRAELRAPPRRAPPRPPRAAGPHRGRARTRGLREGRR